MEEEQEEEECGCGGVGRSVKFWLFQRLVAAVVGQRGTEIFPDLLLYIASAVGEVSQDLCRHLALP